MRVRNLRPIRIIGNECVIPLTRGLEAVADAGDAVLLGQHNWYAHPAAAGLVYARCEIWGSGRAAKIYMHRMLVTPDPGYVIDHIDGNGLNNRRENLRVCLHRENLRNSASRKKNGLPKGVHPEGRRFRAHIQADGVVYQLGVFDTKEAASDAYQKAAAELHGVFARQGLLP